MTAAARRRHRRSPQYPLATIAPYGPDNTFATKLVVAVLERPGPRGPSTTRTWTTQAVDVRRDPTIAADVAEFLREAGVKHTTTPDRILGCPHQEGIDYPMGRTCPRCPFWAGIDRFTHEPIAVPTPTLSALEVLAALAEDLLTVPEEALASADGHRNALTEPLLAALDRGIADPEGASSDEANLFSYALYLFAKWRETRAYPSVVRWLSLPGEAPFEIGGDIVTQDGARILAAVFDGDLAPIKALVLNRTANEYGRAAGVSALSHLAAWAEVPRDAIVDWFLWLAREGLEREPSQVWGSLANECVDIEALTVFPDLRQAYRDELIDPMFIAPEELDQAEALPAGQMLDETRERYPPIDDVATATTWWDRRRQPDGDADVDDDDEDDDHAWDDEDADTVDAQEPYRAPVKVGRNAPCPCGSGKKYKKCCGK
jgi:hypothetical protein